MKRLLTLLLALCIATGLCACGQSHSENNTGQKETAANDPVHTQEHNENEEPETKPTENEEADISQNANAQITIESCRFADEVRAADSECATVLYEDKDGKVYIDAVMNVLVDAELDADVFSGYVFYDERRYELQYCLESYTNVAVTDKNVSVPGGRVHLFTSLPDAAENEDLEVVMNLNGKEYKSKVEAKDKRAPLEKKTQVKVGDKHSVMDGLITFEVISCKYTKYLQAQDTANTKQYTVGVGPIVDLVLKVTYNFTQKEGTYREVFGYVVINGENVRTGNRIENDNNTDVEHLSADDFAPGKAEYLHIFTGIEETQMGEDMAIRFNLGDVCYYCYVEK